MEAIAVDDIKPARKHVYIDVSDGDSTTDNVAKTAVYSDWNNWDFSNVDPVVKRTAGLVLAFLFFFICIFIPILLSACSTVIPFDSNAVVIRHSGSIEPQPLGPGRIFRPAGFRVQTYSRFDISVEYVAQHGNPVTVRVQDGQVIALDISFQYHLAKEDLVEIFKVHHGGFDHTLSQLLYSTLRDVAAAYPSESFFSNRAEIEAELRQSILLEAEKRRAKITGFQVRAVELPETLNERLVGIQLRQQDARAGQARLELDRIYAESNRTILQLATSRSKRKAEIEQETTVFVTKVNQERDQILEKTKQLITAIQQEVARNISLYEKETDILLEEIDLHRTVVLEDTRRRVEEVTVSLFTNATIYKQETENLKLGYENDIALIEEQTIQNVSVILTQVNRLEQEESADLENYATEVRKQSQLVLQEAARKAAEAKADASSRALQGLPATAYVAEAVAQSILKDITLMDIETPTKLKMTNVLS